MPTLDNLSTPVQNSDVGIKISKPFYDASRTQSQNLIFSSSWPSLPIAFEITIPDATTLATYATTASGDIIVPHNLGFAPLSFYWQVSDLSGQAGMGTVCLRNVASVDKTNVYVAGPVSAVGGVSPTPPINIKCFALDLSVDADYITPVGDNFPSPYDSNFGIKVSKANKDINSRDLRDFVLHSRAQSPLILAVKTEKTVNPANPNTIQYTNKLGFPVWVYGFVRSIAGAGAPLSNADYYATAPYYSQAFPVTVTDGTVSSILFNAGGGSVGAGASLVILRDPMFAPTEETVQY